MIVAAGVLAYAVMDLQEAGVLPGPFSALAPTDPATGAVLSGAAGFPFGWAFDASAVVAPGGPLGSVLHGGGPLLAWSRSSEVLTVHRRESPGG